MGVLPTGWGDSFVIEKPVVVEPITTPIARGASRREIILRFNRGLIGLSVLALLVIALLPM